MTIDEKIKQAAEKFHPCEGECDSYGICLECSYANTFRRGANFAKSEMLADMQKLAEALEKILPEVYCLYLQAYGRRLDRVESSDIVQIKYNRASEEIEAFNAKYKGQK